MPAPNLGPSYDLAVRLATLEDAVRRLQGNPLGQAFSATQSDGSVGIQIRQDPTTGAIAFLVRQGPTTARDPNTRQHATLAYFGQIFAGGVSQDSGVIFSRPTTAQMAIFGNRGLQVLDPAGNQVFATDEYGASPSEIGLNNPWIPLGQPAPLDASKWPSTTSTSMAGLSLLAFPAQHAQVTWYGSTFCPAGTTGSVQVTVNNGAAGAIHAVGAGFTNIGPETISLGSGDWGWHEMLQVVSNAQVTGGSGNVAFQIYGVWGAGSGS